MEKNIEKNKREMIMGLLLITVTYALAMELPYIGKSISQLLIPTIRYESGAIYLSGLLPLIPWIFGIRAIMKSGYIKSKLLVFFGVLLVIGPLISNVIEYTKLPVYALNSDAKSIEIKDSKMDIVVENGIVNLDFECRMKIHKDINDEVEVILYLPESIDGILAETNFLVRKYDKIFSRRGDEIIQYESEIEYIGSGDFEDLFDSHYYYDDYIIAVSVNEEIVENIRPRGMGR